jgi:hypothetical protein
VNDADVRQLVQRIRDRVRRALRKAGKWIDADAAADSGDGVGDDLLPGLAAAAVEGRAALGERAGQRDGRIGRDGRWEPLVKGPLSRSWMGSRCTLARGWWRGIARSWRSCAGTPPGRPWRSRVWWSRATILRIATPRARLRCLCYESSRRARGRWRACWMAMALPTTWSRT